MKANRKFVEEDSGVSAVIGVILMLAITVAIAATVYVYVSGMLPGSTTATPTVGVTYNMGTKIFAIGTPTQNNIDWDDVACKLVNSSGGNIIWLGETAGGDYVAAGDIVSCGGNVTSGSSYTFSLLYNTTGGSMYTFSWTQT